jgi:hypothetical protein
MPKSNELQKTDGVQNLLSVQEKNTCQSEHSSTAVFIMPHVSIGVQSQLKAQNTGCVHQPKHAAH